jgi:hypothetical protein
MVAWRMPMPLLARLRDAARERTDGNVSALIRELLSSSVTASTATNTGKAEASISTT